VPWLGLVLSDGYLTVKHTLGKGNHFAAVLAGDAQIVFAFCKGAHGTVSKDLYRSFINELDD
jgi:hypothetical protein